MRLARGAAGTLVVMAVLASCSDGPEPASNSLPSAAPTSAEASETLPPLGPPDFPMPPEARERSTEGVQAFSSYYIELSNRQLDTLDPSPLRALSKGCETCEELARGYEDSKQAGLRYVGGTITIVSTGTVVVDGDSGEIPLLLEQSAVQVVDAQGNEVPDRSTPVFRISGGMLLSWEPVRSTWVVIQWTADKL